MGIVNFSVIKMPKIETVLQVFVASPSDVKEEREILESVISELNRTWIQNLGLRLELNRWETHVYPSFGSDPQDVVNSQIADDCDIFIGILWGRIGTPTPRSISGTIEEFERAYSRFKKDSQCVDLMVYFKDAPISPSKIDSEQLSKVQEFRKSISDKSIYCAFESAAIFESTVRAHLSLAVQRWKEKLLARQFPLTEPSTIQNKILEPEMEAVIEDESDYGLLDYYDIITRESEAMLAPLQAIAEATIDIGTQVQRRVDVVTSLGTISTQNDYVRFKQVIQLVADDMNRYSSILEAQLPQFSKSRDDAFNALGQTIAIGKEFSFGQNEEAILENQLHELEVGIAPVKEQIASFRDVLEALPKLDSRFNRSRRNVVASLDSVIRELQATIHMGNNILNAFHGVRQTLK